MKKSTSDKIKHLYIDKKYSLRKVAKIMNLSPAGVAYHLDILGIERRFSRVKVKDMVGRRFGKLKVIARDGEGLPVRWVVACDCGNVKSMLDKGLKSRRSCGCMKGPK